MLEGKDHYEVATAVESFDRIYQFINDGASPATLEVSSQENVSISGKALSLGENNPLGNATVDIYPVFAETGLRRTELPEFSINTSVDGTWGPVSLPSCRHYEFVVTNNADPSDRIVHYYREGFLHDNALVYLRTIPPPGTLAGLLLAGLPSDDQQAVQAIFTSSQAVVNGRDTLFVNDSELSNPAFTSADQTTIAIFLYDNDNQMSDLVSHGGLFDTSPFLNAVDYYFEGSEELYSIYEFNGRKLAAPHWPSSSNGVSVIVFD